MSKLLLVRHGETAFNSAHRFQGHTNVELSATGIAQAEKLRDRLAKEKIDLAYASDLKRAVKTAELITSRHKINAISTPELREINYGEMEGLTFDEINRLHPEVANECIDWSCELKFPGGEGFQEFSKRIQGFSERLNKHAPEQTVLVVAHGGPLRLLLCYLLELELWHWRQFQLDVASLSIVMTYPDVAIVNLLNDTSHHS